MACMYVAVNLSFLLELKQLENWYYYFIGSTLTMELEEDTYYGLYSYAS